MSKEFKKKLRAYLARNKKYLNDNTLAFFINKSEMNSKKALARNKRIVEKFIDGKYYSEISKEEKIKNNEFVGKALKRFARNISFEKHQITPAAFNRGNSLWLKEIERHDYTVNQSFINETTTEYARGFLKKHFDKISIAQMGQMKERNKEIILLFVKGYRYKRLAERFNVTRQLIRYIVRRTQHRVYCMVSLRSDSE